MVTRRQKRDADLDKLATANMSPAELALHRRTQLNTRAEHIVQFGALELENQGATSYGAGVRCLIFTAISTLSALELPERRSDLERVRSYCAELIGQDPPT